MWIYLWQYFRMMIRKNCYMIGRTISKRQYENFLSSSNLTQVQRLKLSTSTQLNSARDYLKKNYPHFYANCEQVVKGNILYWCIALHINQAYCKLNLLGCRCCWLDLKGFSRMKYDINRGKRKLSDLSVDELTSYIQVLL